MGAVKVISLTIFIIVGLQPTAKRTPRRVSYRFTTYQDERRVRLVDGLVETNILRVSPVNLRS